MEFIKTNKKQECCQNTEDDDEKRRASLYMFPSEERRGNARTNYTRSHYAGFDVDVN